MRGECYHLTEEELNTIAKYKYDSDDYMNYIGTPLYSSEYFRKQCIEAGFHLTDLYPVYHQGWEMDEWGAFGTKDGKKYQIETSHGGLRPEEIKEISFTDFVKSLFS